MYRRYSKIYVINSNNNLINGMSYNQMYIKLIIKKMKNYNNKTVFITII